MEPEKIYYAVVGLVCAASMLLSPFFYVRRTRAVTPVRRRRQWKVIAVSNLLMIAVLLFVWWKWL